MNNNTLLRWSSILLACLFAIVIIAALFIRFYVFPNIDQYKDDIANNVSSSLKRDVSIGQIKPSWDHFSPHLSLTDVNILDTNHAPALTLKKVDAKISWLSLALFNLRLSDLIAYEPDLVIKRDKNNIIYIAGISTSGGGDANFANWLIQQTNIALKNATITYIDELRGAPPLSLTELNFSLQNATWETLLGRRNFILSAIPSIGSKERIKLTGYFVGDDVAHTEHWYGEVKNSIKDTDLSIWKPWITLPIDVIKGQGSLETYMQFGQHRIKTIETTVALKHLEILANQQKKSISFDHINGYIEWDNRVDSQSISTKNLNLSTNTGLKIKQANGLLLRSTRNQQDWIDANFSVAEVSLNALSNTLSAFNLPKTFQTHLNGLQPRGQISNLKLVLAGPLEAPTEYQINGRFRQLGINAFNKIPGFKQLSGEVDINDHSGQLIINAENVTADLQNILRWPIPLNHVEAQLNWQHNKDKTELNIQQFKLANNHLAGELNGSYTLVKKGSDIINLNGKFNRGDAKHAKLYYPTTIGKDAIKWLDKSIIQGDLSDVNVQLKGKLKDFPFVDQHMQPDPKKGTMLVNAKIKNGIIKFADSWPAAEEVVGTLQFKSKSMDLDITEGHMLNQKVISTHVSIPDVDTAWPVLTATGITEAPVEDAIHYINNSPVKKVTLGFTDTLKTAGLGRLELTVNVPLRKSITTTFKGHYEIQNGTLFQNDEIGMPELSKVNGAIKFDDTGISANQIQAHVAGGPATIDIQSASDKTITINAAGSATAEGLKDTFDFSFLNALSGQATWDGSIIVKKPLVNITINSDLYGVTVDAPAPFAKTAESNRHFTFKKIQTEPAKDTLEVHYEDVVQAKFARVESGDNLDIEQGLVQVNQASERSENDFPFAKGVALDASLIQASVDEWLDFIKKNTPETNDAEGQKSAFKQATVRIQSLDIFGRQFHDTTIIASPDKNGLSMQLTGKEVAGKAEWQNQQNGKVIARLNKLIIPDAETETLAAVSDGEIKRLSKQYPAVDLVVTDFQLGKKRLGELSLIAFEDNTSWIIQKLNISNPDNTLSAEGTWHNWTRNPNTYLNFSLKANDAGKTLARFNQPNAIKDGEAELVGTLQWPGSPHQFDAEHMNGNLTLLAKKGQILKVQPGVGRLLGLISLQSLPRRLTLDFRDLFSEGFAFDRISATAIAKNGVLETEDFEMTGPAALVNISGNTNLAKETQHLHVKVEPHISDSLSLAALAGGPLAGAAAFLAQKILKDPLNKIVSTEYVIGGTWDNPTEEKPAAKPKEKVNNPLDQN